MTEWDAGAAGVMRLPSGRLVRGRALSRPAPEGALPDLGIYLLGKAPDPTPWESRWVRWPDFRLPSDRDDAADALRMAWHRAVAERVEIACSGGHGRTGTALACLAVLDGVPAHDAVAYVRANYDPRAVETPFQRRFVAGFPGFAITSHQQLRALYAAFNARDIDTVLSVMTPDVDWPNAWEGGRASGREAVRAYWERQWAELDPRVEPVAITDRADGCIVVDIHQVVRNRDGDLLGAGSVRHVYELRNGMVARMDVEEPGNERMS